MLHALHHAWRHIWRQPASSAVAIATLGLALALATTTFAVLDTVTHPFVPYRDPDRLLGIRREGGGTALPEAAEQLRLLRDGTSFHAGVALVSVSSATLVAHTDVREVTTAVVSPDFFALLGVEHDLGRFTGQPARLEEGAAIVSERVWRRLFPRGAELADAHVRLDDRIYPVTGVVPRGFGEPWHADVWLPAARGTLVGDRGLRRATFVARLRESATEAQAQRELAQLAERLEATYGRAPKPLAFRTRAVQPKPLHAYDDSQLALAGAAALVLLIACANIGNLLLVRGLARGRELAVRTALGATRTALAKLLLGEAVLLAAGGGVTGVLLSLWSIDLVAAHLPPSLAAIGLLAPRLDVRAVGFGVLATGAAVLLVGLVPALRASAVTPDAVLKDGGASVTRRTRGRYSSAAIAQFALATVLAMGTVLLYRSAQRYAQYPFGYATASLVHVLVSRPYLAPGMPSDSSHLVGRDQMRAHLIALPEVAQAAGFATTHIDGSQISVEVPDGGERLEMPPDVLSVTPEFFRTLGVQVVAGRDFQPGDLAGVGAAIVDRAMATRLWPHGGALGRLVKLGDAHSRRPWLRVVGVVPDVRLRASTDGFAWHRGQLYAVVPRDSASLQFVLRARGDPARLALAARRAIQAVTPQGTIAFIRPWQASYTETLETWRFIALVFLVFAGFGVALAVVGFYGVLAIGVRERLREFAIRSALGAERTHLRRIVLHDATVMALAGIALGGPAAMWGGHLLDRWLFDVPATDAWALIAAEAILLTAAFGAALRPARRASRAQPAEVLRTL